MKRPPLPGSRAFFNRQRLPNPAQYFKSQGLTIKGGGEWKDAICPFSQ
jgi:hypothetical protein